MSFRLGFGLGLLPVKKSCNSKVTQPCIQTNKTTYFLNNARLLPLAFAVVVVVFKIVTC